MSIRLKIVLACLMFSLISAGVGAFAARTQSMLGGLATTIYDHAYVGTSYAGHAQAGFLSFLALRERALGAPAANVARKLLDGVADDLDVAAERATSAKARGLAQSVRARVARVAAAIDPAEPGGADLPMAELVGIDADLTATVHRFGMDGLEARDAADDFVTRTWSLLCGVILGAMGLTVVVGLVLDRAIIPSLARGVGIASAIAGGKLDNAIVAKGRSETARLLRALATMQAAIAGSIARTQALHEAEAMRQKAHQAELTHTLGRLRELSDSTFEGLLIHRDGAVLDANAAFCAMAGLALEEVRGRPVSAFAAALAGPGGKDGHETTIATRDGTRLPVEMRSRTISYAGGSAWVTALRDIRERLAAEERVRFLAHHDGLTGLANRSLLHEGLVQALAHARNPGHGVAVLFIDLDRFKEINDSFGHGAGDLLLQQVAQRLGGITAGDGSAARTGGDEFIVVQAAAPQPSSAARLARGLIGRLSEPYDLGGRRVCVGASIGIALEGDGEGGPDALIHCADLALYQAKSLGRGSFCFFAPDMETAQRERREMERDLSEAIREGRLDVAYQPLFDARSCGAQSCDARSCGVHGCGVQGCIAECHGLGHRRVVGFEALVRWSHATRGPIAPDLFIPMAEATGLVVPLGEWVLETACRAAAAWPVAARIAVNVSARQLKDGRLPGVIAAVLARSGLHPGRLEVEVTESVLIDDADQALEALLALKALGLRVVLDDFGTGYSSLSYLRRFPFDKVKIDRSFIADLAPGSGSHAIVGAILAMSGKLGLQVTAEGVETEDQLALLREAGCDQIQGFLLGRPMPAAAAAALLAATVRPPAVPARIPATADPG